MDGFERQKFIEIILYVLNKTKGIDTYHLFKILYFAEMKHLAKWGVRLVPDTFQAWELGPVPHDLYFALKHIDKPERPLSQGISQSISQAGKDAPNILIAKRDANMEYLAASAIDVLNESIMQNRNLSFSELKEKSHDAAWAEARMKEINGPISRVSMAKVLTQDPGMLEFIQETIEIEDFLK